MYVCVSVVCICEFCVCVSVVCISATLRTVAEIWHELEREALKKEEMLLEKAYMQRRLRYMCVTRHNQLLLQCSWKNF